MHAGTYRVGRSDICDTLIIASEPLTYEVDDWTLVPANHIIVAMPGSGDTDSVTDVIVEPVRAQWRAEGAAAADAASSGECTTTATASKIPTMGLHTGGEPI